MEKNAWYRSATKKLYGEWKMIPSEMQNGKIILRNVHDGRFFCPIHCRWERFSMQDEFHFVCEKGKASSGLLVPFVLEEKKKTLPEFRGVLILSQDGVRKPDFLEEKPDETWDRDEENILYDECIFSVTADYEKKICTVSSVSINRKKFLSYNEGNLFLSNIPYGIDERFYYFEGKYITRKGKTEKIYDRSDVLSYGYTAHLPHFFENEIEKIAQKMVNAYAGRKIRINKTFYHGEALLKALAYFPYEANLYTVTKETKLQSAFLEERHAHENPNAYNDFCAYIGIKSFRTLRKLFETEPSVLKWYKNLYTMGFRDLNIIIEIVELCVRSKKEYLRNEENRAHYERRYDWINGFGLDGEGLESTFFLNIDNYGIPPHSDVARIEPFVFFCGYAIPIQGERATWHALNKEPHLVYRERWDIAHMFRNYFTQLRDEEIAMVLRDGFTTQVHNTLSRITGNLQYENFVFEYTKSQKALADEIDGYTFSLPSCVDEMHTLGARMHNCVFSYWQSVKNGNCTIVSASVDGSPKICIEVGSHGRILQVRAPYNASLSGEQKKVFGKWQKKHSLWR